VTWDQAVEQFLGDHEVTWKNSKHRQQWRNTLSTYVSPTVGRLSVAAIDTPEVTKVLDPIWHTKPETASRVRGRIERVLDWSKVRGYRTGENPSRWRGHLDKVYPPRGKVRKVKHHAALAIDDVPKIYGRLRDANGVAAKAQRFVILTVVRASVVTGARWPEIDRKAAVWTVPAERTKTDREHRVPLSKDALAILDEMAEMRTDDRVFPGQRDGKPLSLTGLSKALAAAGGGDATTHGIRSSFKDWASERTSFPSEVSEMALAHAIGDKVEAAYRRGEFMVKRTAMMAQWATFVRTMRTGTVVPIGRRRRVA
jgi:integrase